LLGAKAADAAMVNACWNYVSWYFRYDERKTWEWFETENPLLKNAKPMDMIIRGKAKQLLKWIAMKIDSGRLD
jgi:hypothetical protein